MPLEIIGPHPFSSDEAGRQNSRIGTLFLGYNVLFTAPPGVHACQRASFVEVVNSRRARQGLGPLSPEEEEQLAANSVDLIFEPDHTLIRPDPEHMDLAFAADDLLQELVSKRLIKFLSVSDRRVREAIKRRGECWRLSSIPKTREAKERLVFNSKVDIHGLRIYFYNRLTGTRWLTFQEFQNLGALPDDQLAAHLQEITDHSQLRNRSGHAEVSFFAADLGRFGAREFAGVAYRQLAPDRLRAKFLELVERFRSAVHEAFRKDDCHNRAWCERILSTLFLEGNETETDQILSGLTPEFFLQIEWLPGGRFEEGEFLFDSVFDEAASHPENAELQRLCDPRTKGLVFNLIREYGDLDFVNVGSLPESLSLDRPQKKGRRAVYIAEFKSRSELAPIKSFIRLQKWDVWEHLDEGQDLLQAMRDSDDYTDYCLDRRLGCRQLGMNLAPRVVIRRIAERYQGANVRYHGQLIRTTYFEREYLSGLATDKLPLEKYARPGYATGLAKLLGIAAASNLIVGRTSEFGSDAIFDDGDELVRHGEDGLPAEILVSDHSGSFGEYRLPLEAFAANYAKPVNNRANVVPDPVEFAQVYLDALVARFAHIQGDYAKRRRAFDTLFKHCKYDTAGSFAYRWECTLRRLDATKVSTLSQAIRQHISVLQREAAYAT
jgi:hypothetical protein